MLPLHQVGRQNNKGLTWKNSSQEMTSLPTWPFAVTVWEVSCLTEYHQARTCPRTLHVPSTHRTAAEHSQACFQERYPSTGEQAWQACVKHSHKALKPHSSITTKLRCHTAQPPHSSIPHSSTATHIHHHPAQLPHHTAQPAHSSTTQLHSKYTTTEISNTRPLKSAIQHQWNQQ